jgi:anthranilate synthase component 1
MIFSHITTERGQVASIAQAVPYQADPLACFQQFVEPQQAALLLESAEIDSKDNLKSLLLIDAALRIECQGLTVTVEALTPNGATLLPFITQQLTHLSPRIVIQPHQRSQALTITFAAAPPLLDETQRLLEPNPFSVLRVLQQLHNPSAEPFAIFLGGVIGYDMVAVVEDLPEVATGANDCPDYVFYVAQTLLVIDHQHQHARLIGNVFCGDDAMANCFAIGRRLETLTQLLSQPFSSHSSAAAGRPQEVKSTAHVTAADIQVDISDDDFAQQVGHLKQNIIAGDVFQVVPSRCFSLACPDPLAAYAQLKCQNPSPYMFYMHDRQFTLFGASPESALKFDHASRQVEIYPIAGTRRRGFTSQGQIDRDLDSRIELELRQDEKEKAEHLMLVDLARNDVARISIPGSRYVKELLKVDRYSYVMHLVSKVVGTLKDELDALHAYQACMNMGTLVGAPKVRAAELIRQVEQKRRGSYGGAVGYLNGLGDFDSCIVIRSAYVTQGVAQVQAGAGVVFDSEPQAEMEETRSKAMAVLRAIQSSQAYRTEHPQGATP